MTKHTEDKINQECLETFFDAQDSVIILKPSNACAHITALLTREQYKQPQVPNEEALEELECILEMAEYRVDSFFMLEHTWERKKRELERKRQIIRTALTAPKRLNVYDLEHSMPTTCCIHTVREVVRYLERKGIINV